VGLKPPAPLTIGERARLGLSLTVTAVCLAGFLAAKSPRILALSVPDGSRVREAAWWHATDLGVQCDLCPFRCYLPEGSKGRCRVRFSRDGALWTGVWGQPVTVAVDPIEKKPVFHMLPGSAILSLATVGCPLRCDFCQNWAISQCDPETVRPPAELVALRQTPGPGFLPPADVVALAVKYRIPSIAFTYSEPAIFWEYMFDVAKLAKRHGLHNVMVTSGWINSEPLKALAPYLDVVKVDLKGIREDFYRTDVGARLGPVLDTLRLLKRLGVLVEVVNLVVPTRNDADADLERLARWVRDELGADTPLFFSRFHPDYRFTSVPATAVGVLDRARRIAMRAGLHYVYVGNVPGDEGENTYCPKDGTLLIRRSGYQILRYNLVDGRCPVCGHRIPGIWRK
jgi:pyruvate formate lyase activating enzyme